MGCGGDRGAGTRRAAGTTGAHERCAWQGREGRGGQRPAPSLNGSGGQAGRRADASSNVCWASSSRGRSTGGAVGGSKGQEVGERAQALAQAVGQLQIAAGRAYVGPGARRRPGEGSTGATLVLTPGLGKKRNTSKQGVRGSSRGAAVGWSRLSARAATRLAAAKVHISLGCAPPAQSPGRRSWP